MIAVIADDLAGAAELANAALEAGLSAEVQLRFCAESDAAVICIDTNSRSLPPAAAAARVGQIARDVGAAGPEFVYKKCDSVLRGSVAAESSAIASALGKKRIVLISANPSRQRIIRDGCYFVNGIPLDKTDFATDPEHPRLTSCVVELLGGAMGLETPDATSAEDLTRHAATVGTDTLPAGAVDFFNALLALKVQRQTTKHILTKKPWHAENPSLYVCGSTTAWLAGRGDDCARRNIPVFPMPSLLFELDLREEILARWAAFAAEGLRERGAALIAIGGEQPAPGLSPSLLAERLTQAADLVLQQVPVSRVFLEGGATAIALVEQLGLDRFHIQASPGPGTGALRPVGQNHPVFLIKPGSYSWPAEAWMDSCA